MQDKHKVTLYLPSDLHRQLKIRAAVDAEPMSSLAERAIGFYLTHGDVIERLENHGATHRIYNCPECETPVVMQDGRMLALGQHAATVTDAVTDELIGFSGEELLVPC
jgi:hypothetical protein